MKKKYNHTFKSISECSYDNNINSNANFINKKEEIHRKYQYDIRIHNINVHKRTNRSVSYENLRCDSNRYSLEKCNRERVLSYDKNQLKMQNAQNIQVIQDEKLYQLIVPIPPNKIENSNNFQISGNNRKQYMYEEIKEIIKI